MWIWKTNIVFRMLRFGAGQIAVAKGFLVCRYESEMSNPLPQPIIKIGLAILPRRRARLIILNSTNRPLKTPLQFLLIVTVSLDPMCPSTSQVARNSLNSAK